MGHILVVDDEPAIVAVVRGRLEQEGFAVQAVSSGEEALDHVEADPPDLIVLDVMLPGQDGFEVLRHLRGEGNTVPIVMLTARDEDVDKIVGLELGADDYLAKPFNPRELVARVKAILRRSQPAAHAPGPIHVGDVTIDPARREAVIAGQTVELRPKEFDLLTTMAEHKGIVLSREKLLELVWGYDFYGETRTVDVHIAHLRKRLADSNVEIETVLSVGYKLIA